MSETQIPSEEPAHDVLAAEMFGMPGADPELHHGPVQTPDDPAGILEPHDVLAAEEFPMPAHRPPGSDGALARRGAGARPGALLLLALVLLMLRRRRRRRGRQSAP